MSPAGGLFAVPAGAHAAPASATSLGNIDEEPSTPSARPHPIGRQDEERFDRKQCQSARNGIRASEFPGQVGHSSIGERDDLGAGTAAGLSQEVAQCLGRWGIANRDGIEGGPYIFANTVNRVHEVVAGMTVEIASVLGRDEPCGLTPRTDVPDGFEQFVVGDRLLAMKDRVRQVEYDMSADEVTGLPRGDDSFEIHGNHHVSRTE